MTQEWHDHHFITGVPCLDLANTVVWRSDPAKRTDRLKERHNLKPWIEAAMRHGALNRSSQQAISHGEALIIRETTDQFFRTGEGWALLVALYAKALARNERGLAAAILGSAVELRFSPAFRYVKVCGNCGWLFIDRTRNQNKKWCISAMCGSRTKAKRHYLKKRALLRQASGGNRRGRAR